MKFIVAVALFAFVALQSSHAAPVAEDDKKAETPVASAVPAESAPAPSAVAAAPEVPRAAEPAPETPAVPAAPAENAKPTEEKKA